jgi:transcriptional regulator with XRE-family HTH domain
MKYDDAAAIGRIIARHLRERREEKGYSYRRLEKKTGLDRRYLSRIETGEVNPTVIQAIRIADALGLTLGGVASRAQREWKAQKRQNL